MRACACSCKHGLPWVVVFGRDLEVNLMTVPAAENTLAIMSVARNAVRARSVPGQRCFVGALVRWR